MSLARPRIPALARLPKGASYALVAAVAVVAVGVPGAGVAAYASGAFAAFAPGTTVAGVDLTGMSRAEAVHAVRGAVEDELDRKATVRVADRTYSATRRALGVRARVRQAIDDVLWESSRVSWWDRVTRGGRSPAADVSLTPPSPRKVAALVHRAVTESRVQPRDASLRLVGGAPQITKERAGYRLAPGKVRAALVASLADGRPRTVGRKVVEPEVTAAAFETVIVVNTTLNRLYLFKAGELARTYPVATGMPSHATPHGRFEVTLKRPHPTWVNPAPDGWGKNEPKMIPPGPSNPLGLRALNISAPGIRIHGTPADWSIGYNVSHGCIRMHNFDVLELYPLVPTGATVFIVGGGPPTLPEETHAQDPAVAHTEGQ